MRETIASIMVPLDGSALAEAAIPFALAIARHTGSSARIELVHVHDPGVLAPNAPAFDTRWEDEQADEMIAAVRARAESLASDTGAAVTAVLLRGATAPALAQHAVDSDADLIVTTTHGRSGFSHLWLGSIAEQLIHSATTPLLIVRPVAAEHRGEQEHVTLPDVGFRRILLPIDRESSGAQAMKRALAFGTHEPLTLTLLTVLSPVAALATPYLGEVAYLNAFEPGFREKDAVALLERVASPARKAGATVDVQVITHHQAGPAILDVAVASKADLIVLPAHERSGLSRALFGSVADKVMRGAAMPLLIFRAT